MKKFLVVLLPVILIGSLASIMFVAATNVSPCPVALPRPDVGWTQPATPALAMPGVATSMPSLAPHEVWAIDHQWNEDGTALLASIRMPRGNGSPFAPPNPLANPGGFVNIRQAIAPGGRAIPTEYGNVITQVPAGTIVFPVDPATLGPGAANYFRAWTFGGCTEWWVLVDAWWTDAFGVAWGIRGVMISSMLVLDYTGFTGTTPVLGPYSSGGVLRTWRPDGLVHPLP